MERGQFPLSIQRSRFIMILYRVEKERYSIPSRCGTNKMSKLKPTSHSLAYFLLWASWSHDIYRGGGDVSLKSPRCGTKYSPKTKQPRLAPQNLYRKERLRLYYLINVGLEAMGKLLNHRRTMLIASLNKNFRLNFIDHGKAKEKL